MCQTDVYETSNKSNNLIKRLNPRISKDEGLNWSKISRRTNFKMY